MKNVEAVLFDLDGTLINTYEAILRSMRHAMRTVLGQEHSDEWLMRKVGQPLRTQMMDYAHSEEECDELLRVYREYQAGIHDEVIKAYPGTQETLAKLVEAGYPLGVVTSKLHGPAKADLEFFNLGSYFNCLVGADDCEQHKPDPHPVVYGAELLGFDVKNCLYVGDSPYDMQAGNSAGATTVAALWGMFSIEVLEAENPAHSCRNIAELLPLLGICE